jgi:hypothetical protein
MIRHLILWRNAGADLTRECGKKYARWEGGPRNPWNLASLLPGGPFGLGQWLEKHLRFELRLQKEKVRGEQGGVREN